LAGNAEEDSDAPVPCINEVGKSEGWTLTLILVYGADTTLESDSICRIVCWNVLLTSPGNANAHREQNFLQNLGKKAITSDTSFLVLRPCWKNKNN
jgi:hypothetical protein